MRSGRVRRGAVAAAPVWLAAGVAVAALSAATAPAAERPKERAKIPAAADKVEADVRASFVGDVCRRIETAARDWQLPPAFFARLIWRESRFDPNAISPKGASGIAQFMPGTARHRGVRDPFDPRSAIPASAHYLSDLRNEFGNLGLAAAAYNAGPNRVRRWRDGRDALPAETRDFVLAITGHSAQQWNGSETPKADYRLDRELSFLEACSRLPIRRFRRLQPQIAHASAGWQPWGVHLTADWSPTKALSHYARIQREFPAVLAGVQPMVLKVVNYSFGRAPRFEVRVGKQTRGEANTFCKRLRQAGGLCRVYKTQRR